MRDMTLPISGRRARIRLPNGHEELMLRESPLTGMRLGLQLLGSLAADIETPDASWENLPVGDLDALVLELRGLLLGDHLLTDAFCAFRSCGERFDLSFSIREYLFAARPRRPRDVIVVADAPDWWTWRGQEQHIRFRFPSAGDIIALESEAQPEQGLRKRCLFPDDASAALRRKAETAMEIMAPSLSSEITGECPHCGRVTVLFFEPLTYCLSELRNQTLTLYDEIHAIARAYHWSEDAILSLPRARRVRYADSIQSESRE